MNYELHAGDCLELLRAMPADSVDLVFSSPPYEMARLYLEGGKDLGIARNTEQWVAWMVEVTRECLRVCNGLVCWVVEGQTRKFRYTCSPFLLMADLHRAGVCLRKPAVFHRVGIPGSGGPDWLRNDWEPIICCTRGGKLPWSDNTACGSAPRWASGGAMSHRLTDGTRRNQWGSSQSLVVTQQNGERSGKGIQRPSHKLTTKAAKRRATSGHANGDTTQEEAYEPPAISNPGNVLTLKVGGGLMGHPLAHENEAPFPVKLPDFFIRSFCRPGGRVLDPFCGSGSTGQAAIEAARRFVGFDLRPSQVELSRRRLSGVTPALPGIEA